jgi:hypothetical protein
LCASLSLLAVDPKNDHLRALDGAADRLALYRADLLAPESLATAFAGCEGVFHAASPVTDDPVRAYYLIISTIARQLAS